MGVLIIEKIEEIAEKVAVAIIASTLSFLNLGVSFKEPIEIKVAIIDSGFRFNNGEPSFVSNKVISYDSYLEGHYHYHDHGESVLGVFKQSLNESESLKVIAYSAMEDNSFHEGVYVPPVNVALSIVDAVESGAKIINISLAGEGRDLLEEAAIRYASLRGALVVVAAGNTGKDVPLYPCALKIDNVICVGGVESSDISSASSYGDHVDVYADPNSMDNQKGTSFAAPRVTKALAHIMKNNTTSPQKAKRIFLSTLDRKFSKKRKIKYAEFKEENFMKRVGMSVLAKGGPSEL